jgi:hypothetical protein
MTRRQRTRESLRRRRPSVAPRACVLIVCEGLETEPRYFKALQKKLRLLPVEIEVVGQGAAPKTVVERAVELLKGRRHEVKRSRADFNYDHVWCVIDAEQQTKNPSLLPALVQAQDNGINVALSNPCFEYWFILHFADSGRPLVDARGVIRELRKHIPGYEKAQDVYETLWPAVDRAAGRSKASADSHERAGTDRHLRDPSTEVHELVELLRRTAARPQT